MSDEDVNKHHHLDSLNAEYDCYIRELHRRLQFAKEERKQSEREVKSLQHRVTLLLNQEKLTNQRFEKIRLKLSNIHENTQFTNKMVRLNRDDKNRDSLILKQTNNFRRESQKSSRSTLHISNYSIVFKVLISFRAIMKMKIKRRIIGSKKRKSLYIKFNSLGRKKE